MTSLVATRKIFTMNVLLVDDTWGNLFALSQLFKKLNHKFRMKIDQLLDGDVAVEDFMNRNRQKSEENIHLIVTDKNMNNMDGDQVAREIRALVKDQGFVDTVIVGHSSDDASTTIKQFLDAGADYFERKPPNIHNFEKILNFTYLKFNH